MRKTLIAALVLTLILSPGEAFAAKPSAEPRQETVDIGVTLTGTPSTATVGETVTFTSVVANPGPITASNIDFDFSWWGAMELVGYSIDRGSCREETRWTELICGVTSLSKGQKATLSVTVRVVESAHAPVPVYSTAWSDKTDSNPDDNHVYLYTTVLADPNAPLARCAGVASGTSRVTCRDWFQWSDGGQAHMKLEPSPDFSGVLSAQVIEDFCDWTDACQELRGTFVNGTLVHGTAERVVILGSLEYPHSYEFQVTAAPLETVGAGVPPVCRGVFMGTGMGFEVCTPSAGTGNHSTGTAAVGSFQGTLTKI